VDLETVEARPGRPVLALALYLLAVFAGGALLAPWLYHGVRALAAGHEALGTLTRMPFARFVNRALLITALLGLPLFIRAAGIRAWTDVGVSRGLLRPGRFAAGFALGFTSLAAVCGVVLLAGGRLPRARTPGDLAAQFLGALATALLVAALEELLFRGAFFGGLRRAVGWKPALAASSLLYGIVHFMARPANPPAVDWLSGLRVLPTMLAGMTEVRTLVPGLLSLTLAGVILALAYQWTGEISASIGIHAGWIFWLKYYGLVTRDATGADVWFWGTRRLTDGWLAFVSIVIVLLLLQLARRSGRFPESAGAGG
jgi:uncharacterized protein